MKFTRHLLQEFLESAVFSFLNILFVTGDLAVMIYALVNEKIILSSGSHTFRRSVDPFLERSGDEDGDSHQDGHSLARIDIVEIVFCFLFLLLNGLELLAFSTHFRKHLHRHLLALADTALVIIILTCIFTHRVPLLKVAAGTIRFIFAIVHLIYCIVELEARKLEKEIEHMMDKKLVGVVVVGGTVGGIKRDAPEGEERPAGEKPEESVAKEVEFSLEEATAHAQE